MNDGATRELVFVLAVMAALLLFGVIAVVVFVRTWRKEKKK
jgi:type II secretory pathway pseudopilin PulG